MHPIKKYCTAKGILLKDFAEAAGLYPQEISDFLAGRKNPGPIAAERIKQASHGEITFADLRPDLAKLLNG